MPPAPHDKENDMGNNVVGDSRVFELFNPGVISTTTAGSSVDLGSANYEDGCIYLNIGTVVSLTSLDITVEHSTLTGSGFVAYTEPGASAAAAFAQKTATGGPFRLPLNMRGMNQFIRVVATLVGTSFIADILLVATPKYQPAVLQP